MRFKIALEISASVALLVKLKYFYNWNPTFARQVKNENVGNRKEKNEEKSRYPLKTIVSFD